MVRQLFWTVCLMVLIWPTQHFTFIYPTISLDILTINQVSTYTLIAFRNFDINLNPTPWDTQLVPSNSNITFILPKQYNMTANNITCANLQINNNAISTFTCSHNSNNITIVNGIPNAVAIANLSATITGIKNPYPAVTTSPFLIQIGNDISSSSTSSSVTLQSAQFSSCSITFNPSFTNTTSGMLISISPTNPIYINGTITVQFAIGQPHWVQDLATTRNLPIDGILSCGITTGQISSISCVGSSLSATITITILTIANSTNSNSTISVNTPFIIQINNLFSPPTIEPNIDSFNLHSFSSNNYPIDRCTTSVTGLTPQNMKIILTPSNNPFYVNSVNTLRVDFNFTDTVSKNDYFLLIFPPATIINNIFKTSNLQLSTTTYNITTNTITFKQSTSASTRFALFAGYITFLSYQASFSTRTTSPIIFQVVSSTGYPKMQGNNTLTAIQKTFPLSASTLSSQINANTTYILLLNFTSDSISSSGMMYLTIPSQLSLPSSNNSQCPTTNTSNAITCGLINSTTIFLKSILNGTYSSPFVMQVNISLTNTNKSVTISPFIVKLYTTNNILDLMANATSNTITLLPNTIAFSTIAVSLSNYEIQSYGVTYTIAFALTDAITNNGYVLLKLPIEITILNTNSTSLLCQYALNNSTLSNITCSSLPNNTFMISLNSITTHASDVLSLSLISCCMNPHSNRPTHAFQIYSYSVDNYLINYNNISFTLQQIYLAKAYLGISLSRANTINSMVSDYIINLEQNSTWQNNSYLLITIPSQITLNTNTTLTTCINLNNNNNLPCAILSTIINNITTNQLQINLQTYISSSITIKIVQLLVNPFSFQPSPPFSITTYTSDNYLSYADTSTLIVTNNKPSEYTVINNLTSSTSNNNRHIQYSFSNSIYESYSNLSVRILKQISSNIIINKYILNNLNQYVRNINEILQCDNISVTCSHNNNSISITPLNNGSIFTFTTPNLQFIVFNLYIPLNNNLSNITIYSYNNQYLVSIGNIQFNNLCILPCKQCQSFIFRDICLSCFNTTTLTTSIWYYNLSCIAQCPISTYSSTNTNLTLAYSSTFLCLPCNINCQQCLNSSSICSECYQNSSSKYLNLFTELNQISNISMNAYTCVTTCNATSYPNSTTSQTKYTPVCLLCSLPCFTCTSYLNCTSCDLLSINKYYYQKKCLNLCPLLITVPNVNTSICEPCSIQCLTCENSTSTCLSCNLSSVSRLFLSTLHKCVSSCPSPLVAENNLCTSCSDPCLTCLNFKTNCTSCSNTSGTYLSLLNIGNLYI